MTDGRAARIGSFLRWVAGQIPAWRKDLRERGSALRWRPPTSRKACWFWFRNRMGDNGPSRLRALAIIIDRQRHIHP